VHPAPVPGGPASAAGVIAEIVLDRPAALNALSTAMLVSLAHACGQVAADGDVRAVLLTAAGQRAFCVGADLKERAAMTDEQIWLSGRRSGPRSGPCSACPSRSSPRCTGSPWAAAASWRCPAT